jgi:hypothetical protein
MAELEAVVKQQINVSYETQKSGKALDEERLTKTPNQLTDDTNLLCYSVIGKVLKCKLWPLLSRGGKTQLS